MVITISYRSLLLPMNHFFYYMYKILCLSILIVEVVESGDPKIASYLVLRVLIRPLQMTQLSWNIDKAKPGNHSFNS